LKRNFETDKIYVLLGQNGAGKNIYKRRYYWITHRRQSLKRTLVARGLSKEATELIVNGMLL
jgi:hypothetical protein